VNPRNSSCSQLPTRSQWTFVTSKATASLPIVKCFRSTVDNESNYTLS